MMTTRTIADQIRICSSCDREQSKEHYSKNQWKKGEGAAKCKACIEETSLPTPPSHCSRVCAPTTSPLPTHHNSPKPASTNVITTISLQERPQIPIPGFDDGLSCCADWPKTKSGHPPGAQSAVYNPLLACVFGVALRDHCTLEQLTVAHAWWNRALPAWPRWVEELRRVGVNDPVYRNKLLASAKGRPNPLIHKAKGRGTYVYRLFCCFSCHFFSTCK